MEIDCFTQECLSLYETFQTSVIKCPHSCSNTKNEIHFLFETMFPYQKVNNCDN